MAKRQTKAELDTINETGNRKATDRRKQSLPVSNERRKSPRRRQIDPTTCEREYTDAEIEFMKALDDYKRSSGRMFPTCSEILEVLKGLGYRKSVAACCQTDDCGNPAINASATTIV